MMLTNCVARLCVARLCVARLCVARLCVSSGSFGQTQTSPFA